MGYAWARLSCDIVLEGVKRHYNQRLCETQMIPSYNVQFGCKRRLQIVVLIG